MAVIVTSHEQDVMHMTGTKWVIDDDRNLVVLGATSKAVAIYANGDWTSAVVA